MTVLNSLALAEKLSENTEGFGTFIRSPEKIDPDQTYKRIHEPSELFSAYVSAAGKKIPEEIKFFGVNCYSDFNLSRHVAHTNLLSNSFSSESAPQKTQ